jgi:protoporphyrinogen oxidase
LTPRKRIAIIGGGVAGLTAAYELLKRGREVVVLEQHAQPGGFASSALVGEEYVDRYYHFVCRADHELLTLLDELNLRSLLHWNLARTAYYTNQRLYPFTTPLDLLRFDAMSLRSRVRFGLAVARARSGADWNAYERDTAVEWLRNEVGDEAYDVIWRPLLEMKFGAYAGQVSAAWLRHRIWRVAQSRKGLLNAERFGYLDGGCKALIDALRDEVVRRGGELRLACPVSAIRASHGRVSALATDEGDIACDDAISTVPLPALVPLLPPEAAHIAAALGRIDFTGVVCVLLRLSRRVQDAYWVNINDPRPGFSGFIEFSNLAPPSPHGPHTVYVPRYMPTSDPGYVAPDVELIQAALRGLQIVNPALTEANIEHSVVSRAPFAQPICPTHFSRSVPPLRSALGGLYLTDATQLYPSDRCISGMVGLARRVADAIVTP